METQVVTLVDVNKIWIPENVRRTVDKLYIHELADSIKAVGVLQPIGVRPPADDGLQRLVFGQCRLLAAREAGRATVPTIELDPAEGRDTIEIQLVENINRRDIHPIDEANAYQQLIDEKGYSLDDLAARTGKGRIHIRQRLQLMSLPKKAIVAVGDGRLPLECAVLIGRIPDAKLRESATEALLRHATPDDPVSLRQARDMVHREFMLKLTTAPFDRGDALLVVKAGACTVCPKRTGNQPELFGDVKSADLCTDPACYRDKVAVAWETRKAAAKEAGQTVLEGKAASSLFYEYGGNNLAYGSGYIELKDSCGRDPKRRTWSAVLGRAERPTPVLARDPAGAPRELYREKDLLDALRTAGVKWAATAKPGSGMSSHKSPSTSAAEAKRRREGIVNRAVVDQAIEKLVDLVVKLGPQMNARVWRELGVGLAGAGWYDTRKEVIRRRGLEIAKRKKGGPPPSASDPLKTWLGGDRTTAEIVGLVVELIARRDALDLGFGGPRRRFGATFLAMSKAAGVDVDALARAADKAAAEKLPKKKSAAKPKAATARKRKASRKGGAR